MQRFDHESGNYLKVDDARIYVEEKGNKNLPVLLLLHGGLGNMEHFNAIIPQLSDYFRIIGIDSRGHGKSTLGSMELSYELLQMEVEKVLEYLQIDSLSIIGFSNGGTIAYRLAAFSKLTIRNLVTIGAPWHTKHVEPLMPFFASLSLDDWKQQSVTDHEIYQRVNPMPNLEKIFTMVKNMGADRSSKGRPNEAIKNIACRLLILRGESDPVVAEEHLKELSALIKGSSFASIPSAGHEAALDQPDIFMGHVLEFLNN